MKSKEIREKHRQPSSPKAYDSCHMALKVPMVVLKIGKVNPEM